MLKQLKSLLQKNFRGLAAAWQFNNHPTCHPCSLKAVQEHSFGPSLCCQAARTSAFLQDRLPRQDHSLTASIFVDDFLCLIRSSFLSTQFPSNRKHRFGKSQRQTGLPISLRSNQKNMKTKRVISASESLATLRIAPSPVRLTAVITDLSSPSLSRRLHQLS